MCVAGVAALLAVAPASGQEPLAVTYDALDLAQRRISIPALDASAATDLEVGIGGTTCVLGVGGGAIADGDCPALWNQEQLSELQLSIPSDKRRFAVALVPRAVVATPDVFDANIPVRGAELDAALVLPYGGALAMYVGGTWRPVNVPSSGRIELDSDVVAAVKAGRVLAYTEQTGSLTGYFRFWLVPGPPRPEPAMVEPQSEPRVDPRVFDLTQGFCRRARAKHPRNFVVCVDAERREAIVSTPGHANVLKPNTSVTVVVRHLQTHTLGVSVDGERGVFVAGVRVETGTRIGRGGGEAKAEFEGHTPAPEPAWTVRERTMAPRLPGPVDVVVEVLDESGEVWSRASLELVVEQTYSSALRVGVAGVFLDAVDREYVARTQPGAGQAEVVAVETGGYDLEVVAGVAAFLEENGRGYSSHDFGNFAPYLGIGVLAQGADGSLDFLKSVHLGVEWELTPTFSLASTLVLRRVTRLAPGVALGGPVQGDVPTVTQQSIGVGFVLNVSPEFLRVGSLGGF